MPTVHAFDYLAAPEKTPPAAVNVLFGDEPFLRSLVLKPLREQLAEGRADVEINTFGEDTPWRDISDELSTSSLFGGGGRRLVMIEDADRFVSEHRQRLEDYVAKPRSTSALILSVDSWAANTRLYKAVDATGLQIQCSVPSRPRSKEPDVARLAKWLSTWARQQHKISLEAAAAEELVQIVGPYLGLLDQDLAKLALYVPSGGKVNVDMVREIVGGWRLRTVWQMLDDVADGKVAAGLEELDHLIRSGSEPQALFGQISWSLRRFATATRIFETAERQKQRIGIADALEQAGFRKFPQEQFANAQRQIRQLTRQRASKLHQWLLETDLALKGSHSSRDRARLALEKLFVKLAKETAPKAH